MKGVQCYELFGGIALKNHAFSFFFISIKVMSFFSNSDVHKKTIIVTLTIHEV